MYTLVVNTYTCMYKFVCTLKSLVLHKNKMILETIGSESDTVYE